MQFMKVVGDKMLNQLEWEIIINSFIFKEHPSILTRASIEFAIVIKTVKVKQEGMS